MRADVKLGMVCSAVIVLLAGGYYLWRSPDDAPIRLSDSTSTTKPDAPAAGVKKQPTPRPATRHATPMARNRTAPGAGHRTQPTDRRSPNQAANASETAGKRAPAKTLSHAQQNRRTQVSASASGSGDVARHPSPTRTNASRSPNNPAPSSNRAITRKGLAGRTPNTGRPTGAPNRNEANRQSPSRQGARAARTLTATRPTTSRVTTNTVAVETHVVQPGDSFAALARRYYGSERYTDYLLKSNPQVADPNRLKIGASLRIPSRPDEPSAAGAPSRSSGQGAGRTYRVRKGDSFYAIARDRLGDASRWRELFELNKDRVNGDPTTLRVGQEIALPAK